MPSLPTAAATNQAYRLPTAPACTSTYILHTELFTKPARPTKYLPHCHVVTNLLTELLQYVIKTYQAYHTGMHVYLRQGLRMILHTKLLQSVSKTNQAYRLPLLRTLTYTKFTYTLRSTLLILSYLPHCHVKYCYF